MSTRSSSSGDAARAARRAVMAAVAVGLVLRLAFALGYWQGKPLTHDEREYLALGANLAQGRGFESDLPAEPRHERADTFGRAPLYPAFLAPLTRFSPELREGRYPPDVPAAIKIAQCLVAVLAVPLGAALARRAGGHRAGAIAAWVVALHPALTWIAAYALSEALYVPIVLSLALVLGGALDRRHRAGGGASTGAVARGRQPAAHDTLRLAAGGLLCGVAALVRPSTVFAVPLVAGWLLWRRRWLGAALFVAATAAAIAPWTLRNLSVYERPVIIASEGGVTFWTGNHPLAIGEGDMAANPAIKEANLALRARHPGLSPEALEQVYYREAFAWIRAEPVAWLWLLARKAFFTVVPIGPSYRLHSPLYLAASVVPYLLLLPLAVAGARRALASAAPPVTMLLLVASTIAASILFLPQERFRIPIVDPALAVFASVWLGRPREVAP